MRTALINLPYPKPVMRRYVASYFAPNFLIPPLELMSLGAIVREWKHDSVILLDAIANSWDNARLKDEIHKFAPDLLVAMSSFNIFAHDLTALDEVAASRPQAKIILFGYLASQFSAEILRRTKVDIVIRGEPELSFSEFYDCLKKGRDLSGVSGISYKAGGEVFINPERPRILDPDSLPFADHSLIDINKYSESFLERPIGVILSERGCPYQCSFCVRTYGRQLALRSAKNILQEIELLIDKRQIRNIRFLSDTFTADRKRLQELCRGMLDRKLNIAWTCLTRLDAIDRESLQLMKSAGCRRIYVGIESGSQRILDYYRKNISLADIRQGVALIKDSGIQTSAFFIVGAPGETEDDVAASVRLAKAMALDYIIVTKLQYWPGTELYEQVKDELKIDIFAAGGILEQNHYYRQAHMLQKKFYREFYLTPGYILKRLRNLFSSPRDILRGLVALIKFLWQKKDLDDFI